MLLSVDFNTSHLNYINKCSR